MVIVVLDTNVLISALVGHGKPRRLVLRLLEEETVVSSMEMLAELADVLSRGKFTEVKSSQVNSFLSKFARGVVLVTFKRRFKIVGEDPDDDIVLSTAYGGDARYIITGDKHLLKLKKFRGIEIVTVKEMLELLRNTRKF
jgi:putative PIN family toxin of toxin-antitoxin system